MLHQSLELALDGEELLAAQVAYLLGQTIEVQVVVEPQGLQAAQLARLLARPGVEVLLIEADAHR